MEYATREQAQQAVNTLSNQNLMGRLVYVREVSAIRISQSSYVRLGADCYARIARLNLVLQPLQPGVAADSTVDQGVDSGVILGPRRWVVAEAAVGRSMSTTFVS